MATILAKQPIHVADQGSLLAIPLSQLYTGDIVIRDDNDVAYMLIGSDPGVFENWEPITGATSAGDLATEIADRIAGDATTLATAEAYADALISNRQTKNPARFVTTTNIALSGLSALADGTPVAGDRILVAGQTTGSQNGIYNAATGSWTRATDADTTGELLPGCIVWVSEGTTYADSAWELTTDGTITIGTTAQTWTNYYKSGLYATAAALTAETSARTTADTTLQTNITNEAATARAAETANATSISNETTARIAADTGLQTQIDAFSAGLVESASVFTSSFTATAAKIHRVDSTSGVIVATLPTAPADKTQILIKLVIQGGTNGVTINTGGSDVLNKTGGSTSYSLSYVNQTVTMQYKATGAIWTIIGTDIPLSATDTRYNGIGQNPITGYWHLADNGGDNTATVDATAALQALVDAVPYGSTIWLDGYFRINTSVKWRSGVSMKSAHHAAGGLRVYTVDTPAIRWNVSIDGATNGTALTDCVFENFELDCSNQTLSGSYTVACKGFVIQYMKRSHFRGLYVHDSHATGIGVDFLQDGSSIVGNIVERCGRSHSSTSPSTGAGGGAGIGIGTANTSNDEELLIANNTVIGNGNGTTANTSYGIFLESQAGSQSSATSGIRIVNNYVSDCQGGIGDAGSRRTLIANNQVTRCTYAGISVDGGTIGSGHPGYDNTVMGNNIYSCNAPGILYGYLNAGGKTSCVGNTVSFCNQGVVFNFSGSVNAAAVFVAENNLHDLQYSGIFAKYPTSGTGGFTESEFSRNFIYNCGIAANTNDRDGIRFEVPLTNVKIDNNNVFDRQGSKTQRYGLITTAAAVFTGGSIRGNDFRNNLTAGVSLGAAVSATTWVGGNAAYNGVAPASVTVTASPMTYTAPDFPSSLFITGGTVSAITIGGVTVAASSERMLNLEASDSVVITYSSAPTLTFRSRG